MRSTPVRLILGATGLLVSGTALSQVLPDAIRACRGEPDSTLRLQCYDREVARYPLTESQAFGLNATQTREAQQRASAAHVAVAAAAGAASPAAGLPKPAAHKLSARVTALYLRRRGVFLAQLDNDQQWEQNEPDGMAGVALGDRVTIEPGLLGSFFLVGESGHWSTKVHRLK